MIIRKPYAFMIKHFRMIHLILTLLLIFLAYKTNTIYSFFNGYAKNGYYTYSANMSSKYINLYMFLAIVAVLLITSFVYLLMKWKKKSRLYYIFLSLFYIILFVGFLVYFNVFLNILNNPLGSKTVRLYRDIMILLYFPQYIFIILGIVRAVGFDIKKFDFKKDLEDLDISEADQEEIEVTFGQNSYKYKRKARRAFREIKYYALENKFFFSIICITMMLVLVLVIYVNFGVLNKKFKESEYFTIDGVVFQVKESYVTNLDLKGNIISPHYKYFIIKVSMKNTNNVRVNLDTDTLRLVLGDEYYLPVYSKSNYFWDLGEGYYNNTLYSGETNEYLIIFEIPMDASHENALFRMVDTVNVINGSISSKHKDVKVDPILYMDYQDEDQVYMRDAISFSETTLNNSEIVVNSFAIGDRFVENYEYCVSECYTGTKIIVPDVIGKDYRTILKLNLDILMDEDLYINKYIKNTTDFFKIFGDIVYLKDSELKKVSVVV